MKFLFPSIDPKKEEQRIIAFLEKTLQKTGFKKLIIGLSGGIDSTTSLYLARKVLLPQNIFIAHLYYFQPPTSNIQRICPTLKVPAQNQYIISIKPIVDLFKKTFKNMAIDDRISRIDFENRSLKVENPTSSLHHQNQSSIVNHPSSKIRLGNIMTRVRMIILFDLAKKYKALVCGTENKSEHLLGYFTRFGDEASDIEPIQHLYKTQVYQIAKHLKIPKQIIEAKPSAGLWTDQTDEDEFGFSYKEADQVLYLYFEKKQTVEEIKKLGYKNAKKIIDFALKNSFKHNTPYNLNKFL